MVRRDPRRGPPGAGAAPGRPGPPTRGTRGGCRSPAPGAGSPGCRARHPGVPRPAAGFSPPRKFGRPGCSRSSRSCPGLAGRARRSGFGYAPKVYCTALPTTALSADVAATAGETSPTSPSCGGTVATPPNSCMAEVDPLLPARRASTPPPSSSYATPSSEYVQTVATRVVYSRGYGAFYVSLLAASITEIVWIFHPWTDHCCRSSRSRPACAAHSPPMHELS